MSQIFGKNIIQTINAFKPTHLGSKEKYSKKTEKTIAYSRIAITIMLLFIATFLFVRDNDSSKMGATIFGAIIGYWLN